jgi:hypothetical protein
VTVTTGAQRVPLQNNRISLQEKKRTSVNSRPTSKLPEIVSLRTEDEPAPMEVVPPTSDALDLEEALLEQEEHLESEVLPESGSGSSLQSKSRKDSIWPDLDGTLQHEIAEQIKIVKVSFNEEVDPYDTTMVSEYSEDIMQYMSELELSTMPVGDYIATQTEITWYADFSGGNVQI